MVIRLSPPRTRISAGRDVSNPVNAATALYRPGARLSKIATPFDVVWSGVIATPRFEGSTPVSVTVAVGRKPPVVSLTVTMTRPRDPWAVASVTWPAAIATLTRRSRVRSEVMRVGSFRDGELLRRDSRIDLVPVERGFLRGVRTDRPSQAEGQLDGRRRGSRQSKPDASTGVASAFDRRASTSLAY